MPKQNLFDAHLQPYQFDRLKTNLNDFMIPSTLGMHVGLRTSAQLLAGIEAERVADFNVAQIETEIGQLNLQSDLQLKQFSRAAERLKGQQITAIATSGFTASGSLVDLMADSQAQLELERLYAQEKTKAQIAAKRTEQELTRRKADAAKLGSYLGAGSELSGGIFTILEKL